MRILPVTNAGTEEEVEVDVESKQGSPWPLDEKRRRKAARLEGVQCNINGFLYPVIDISPHAVCVVFLLLLVDPTNRPVVVQAYMLAQLDILGRLGREGCSNMLPTNYRRWGHPDFTQPSRLP